MYDMKKDSGNKNNKKPKDIVKLTLLQKVALEGEVSSQYETCMHESDEILKTYLMLKYVPSEQFNFYYDECKKYVSEEALESCMRYINKDVFPVSFVTNRFVDDIKLCTHKIEGCGTTMVHPVSDETLKSKFASFVQEFIQVSPKLTREFLYDILTNEETCLDFLKDLAFILKSNLEVDEDEDLEEINLLNFMKLLQDSIIYSNTLSFNKELNKDKSEEISEKVSHYQQVASNSNKTYTVNKVDKSTGQVIFSKEFSTQSEAIAFVKEINKSYPEILQRYKFVIMVDNE